MVLKLTQLHLVYFRGGKGDYFFQATFSIVQLHHTFYHDLNISVSVPIDLKVNFQTPCTVKSIWRDFL